MQRRAFLETMSVGAVVGTAGCIGGGGELVVNVQRDISLEPHTGWIKEIPDVSDPGGAVQYVARSSEPFDVYFFVGQEAARRYDAYLDGDEPDEMPSGDPDLSRTATPAGDQYRATSKKDGARQPVDAEGPYYFVVDHSNYPSAGGAFVGEEPRPRSVFLDLTVSKKRFGLPV